MVGGLGPDDRVLCGGTLLRRSLRELVAAAVAGGFRGVSLWPQHLAGLRAEGLSDADVRAFLSDEGVAPLEVEPVLSWLPPGSLAPGQERLVGPPVDALLALAEAVGAPSLLAVDGFGARTGRAALVDAFGALCEAAARHGRSVKLEFTPWSSIPDAATALAVVRESGAANAGVTVDAWHHFRGANDLEQIAALPGDAVLGVQLSDAPSLPTGEPRGPLATTASVPPLAQESMHARRLPGEGQVDLAGLLRTLDAIGCRAPLGAEVFTDAFDELDAAEIGRRVGASLRALVDAVRGPD